MSGNNGNNADNSMSSSEEIPKLPVNKHYLIKEEDIKYAKTIGIVFGLHIGKGAFADVFYAKYQSNKVALKSANRKKCSKRTLNSEIEVSKILIDKNHENVVKFLNIFNNSDETQFWILMSWVEGEDMSKIQTRMGNGFPESTARDYFKQMVAGLQFLHSLNIVHRDIKPHNILVTQQKDRHLIKYIDFGFAKLVTVDNENKAICSSHKGSQVYMAPELMSEDSNLYDAFKSDIYSLAIVLYEMLFNVLPFGSSDFGVDREERNTFMQKLKESLIIRYPVNSDVSESAKKLIEDMICCESDKRLSLKDVTKSHWINQ